MKNKRHTGGWYDGKFYDIFIAPNQDTAFAVVKSLIEPNSSVLDAGCGTGRLLFQLADKCARVAGVELSKKNFMIAQEKLNSSSYKNISVINSGIDEHLNASGEKYDYAVMSYVIHEIDEEQREQVLRSLAKGAKKIILVDYLYPRSFNFWSALNEAVEFAAGRRHYRNFRSYMQNNGIYGLAGKCGLKIEKGIKNKPQGSHIAVLTS
jgi:2-polyprenyl-3-methyl-5-hydroxy-6-metoxy-1,4-benzoquinol methylase